MVFSSLTFLFYLLPCLIIVYYLSKNRTYRNLVLLLFSLFFYAWGEPIYIILMFISIVNDYYHSILIEKFQLKNNDKMAKLLLISSLLINLALLFFFKYADFLIINLNNLFGLNIQLLKLSLPIGISFYTFQTMSYTIDVYLKKIKAQHNMLTFATYVSLFPQLVAGPIVRYKTIQEELTNRKESISNFVIGVRRFIFGLGKKVIIANNLALIADTIFSGTYTDINYSVAWLGVIAFTLQIYFDFSGYSDMAIGLGKMFGFNFLENFNYPLISKSITEFWRRWHISLSTWVKDYVYIPLGGNRVSKIKLIRNIFIVLVITGLWHGASWNYVLWGVYFGIILIIEKFYISKFLDKIPNILQRVYALFFIIIGGAIFRIEDVSLIDNYLISMFSKNGSNLIEYMTKNPNIIKAIPFIALGLLGSSPFIKKTFDKMYNNNSLAYLADIIMILILIISTIFIISSSYSPFIYFKF